MSSIQPHLSWRSIPPSCPRNRGMFLRSFLSTSIPSLLGASCMSGVIPHNGPIFSVSTKCINLGLSTKLRVLNADRGRALFHSHVEQQQASRLEPRSLWEFINYSAGTLCDSLKGTIHHENTDCCIHFKGWVENRR